MWQAGYDIMAISLGYIPDFKNEQEKKDFEAGALEGLKTRKKLEKKFKETKNKKLNK
jgi:hypothetical protein